jgi:hypothetical protein
VGRFVRDRVVMTGVGMRLIRRLVGDLVVTLILLIVVTL